MRQRQCPTRRLLQRLIIKKPPAPLAAGLRCPRRRPRRRPRKPQQAPQRPPPQPPLRPRSRRGRPRSSRHGSPRQPEQPGCPWLRRRFTARGLLHPWQGSTHTRSRAARRGTTMSRTKMIEGCGMRRDAQEFAAMCRNRNDYEGSRHFCHTRELAHQIKHDVDALAGIAHWPAAHFGRPNLFRRMVRYWSRRRIILKKKHGIN